MNKEKKPTELAEFRNRKKFKKNYPNRNIEFDKNSDVLYNKNKEGDNMSGKTDNRIDLLVEMQKNNRQDIKDIEERMDKRLRDYTTEANEREKRYLKDSREREERYRTESEKREQRLNKKFEKMMESDKEFKKNVKNDLKEMKEFQNTFKSDVENKLDDIEQADKSLKRWSVGTLVALIGNLIALAALVGSFYNFLFNHLPKIIENIPK